MKRDLSRGKVAVLAVAVGGAALAAGVGSGGAGKDPRVLPPEKQALQAYERAQQQAAAARERQEHPNRHDLPKPPSVTQVIKPETSGIAEYVASPFPAAEATVMDRRAYEDVDGARVRMFFGVELADGSGGIAIMHRNNLGVRQRPPGKISFEFVKSPVLEGGLHIIGIDGTLLRLKTDQGTPLTLDLNSEKFT